jgi:small-conductance mechanosensitive channel
MPHVRWRVLSLVLVLALGGGAPVLGQGAGRTGDASGASQGGANQARSNQARSNQGADNEVRLAPVVIDGETLFSVRGVTAFPAERRAREIANRIRAVAANPKIAITSLTLEDQPGGTRILAGSERIMIVLDEDAAIEQVARSSLAAVHRARIGEAIEDYRHDRRPEVLWLHALYALGLTFALMVATYIGRRTTALVRAGMERRYQAHVQRIQDRAHQVVKADQIWHALTGLLNFASTVVGLGAVYFYLYYVLSLFPWTRGLAKSLVAIVIDPLRTMGLGLIGLIPNLAFLTILLLVTRYALKLTRTFFDGLAGGTVTLKGFYPDWAEPTYRLFRILVLGFAIVIAYPYIPGSESAAFKGVSIFFGIVFSLGSSSIIGNIIAGYGMTYRRTFKLGDRVKIGEHVGDVEQTGLLVTHLRTPKNEEVIVPNSMILGNEVINYSSMARELVLILHTTVGIGYETPWRQVEAMLLEAAARTEGLRREPAPFVLQKLLGDFCVTYEINVYCDTPQVMERLYAELHRNILDLFNEYGVQIMTPAYVADPQQPKVVPKEQWYAAPAQPSREPVLSAADSGASRPLRPRPEPAARRA